MTTQTEWSELTDVQQCVVQQLTTRYYEMRKLGHHDGAIFAAMVQEGHGRAAVDLVREAVSG